VNSIRFIISGLDIRPCRRQDRRLICRPVLEPDYYTIPEYGCQSPKKSIQR